jgi:hypothetical protein
MLRSAPYEWTIDALLEHARSGPQAQIMTGPHRGGYRPARPCGYYSLTNRLRLAWMVFKGGADALRWPR